MFVLVPQHFCSVQLEYSIGETLVLLQMLMDFIQSGLGPGWLLELRP